MLQLSDANKDWQERWYVIDSFIRSWLAPGFSRLPDQHELEKLEERVGIRLPASAREWCFLAWAAPQIEQHFIFRYCFVIERLKDHDAVSLLLQGEGDFYWAIETQFLENDDPPVTAYLLDYDSPQEQFVEQGRWAPTVSSFALDYLLTYLDSPGGGFTTRMSSPTFNRSALVAELGTPTTFGHLEFFTCDGIIAYTSLLPDNGHYGKIGVHLQRESHVTKLPSSIRRMLQDAHILQAPLTKCR